MRKQSQSLQSLRAILLAFEGSGVLEPELKQDVEKAFVRVQRARNEQEVRDAINDLSRVFLRHQKRKDASDDRRVR